MQSEDFPLMRKNEKNTNARLFLASGAGLCTLANGVLTLGFSAGYGVEVLDLIIFSPAAFCTFYLLFVASYSIRMRGWLGRGGLRFAASFIVFALVMWYLIYLAFAVIGTFIYFLLSYISVAGASRFSTALLAGGGLYAALPALTATLIIVVYRRGGQVKS